MRICMYACTALPAERLYSPPPYPCPSSLFCQRPRDSQLLCLVLLWLQKVAGARDGDGKWLSAIPAWLSSSSIATFPYRSAFTIANDIIRAGPGPPWL